jgi:TRAP-type transport system periplasmic protein
LKKHIPFFLLTGLLILLFSFPAFVQKAQAQAGRELRLCHNSNIDSATDKASHKFAEWVEKKSGGKVKVTIYPRNQLGGNRELLE